MKCEICSKRIETTFMNKIVGTYIVKGKKKKVVCPSCQKNFSSREIREKLNLQNGINSTKIKIVIKTRIKNIVKSFKKIGLNKKILKKQIKILLRKHIKTYYQKKYLQKPPKLY